MDILASLVRDLAVVAAGHPLPVANGDLADDLQRLGASFPQERVVKAMAAIEEAQSALGRNASPKVVADLLAVSL